MALNMGSSSAPQSETITNDMKEKQAQVDRISELPDEILGCILYFLPSKEAAKSSILSSRWKHVFWSTATRLVIVMSKEGTEDSVEPAIQFFEALFNCETLVSARISTNYFHLPEAICVPKLKYLLVESKQDFDSFFKTYDRVNKMETHFNVFVGAQRYMVFRNEAIPVEDYLSEVRTVHSLGKDLPWPSSEHGIVVYISSD